MDDARDLIDQRVLVLLEKNEGLEFIGIESDGPFFCRVAAVDEIGMWIENKEFVTTEIRDSKGRFIPEEKRKPEKSTVNILLPWRNVKTVIKFPDMDPEEVARELMVDGGESRIGFVK